MYTTILKHSEGLTKFFVHHQFYGTGQVKLSLYFMAIYLSLGNLVLTFAISTPMPGAR